MLMTRTRSLLLLIFLLCLTGFGADLRLGIVGTDTSHVIAFTKLLNDPTSPDYVPGAGVVAAFKGGTLDNEVSRENVEQFAREIHSKWNVEIVPDIPTLCAKVDGVLLTSVDGRPHLEQAREIIAAKKPLFIDKPLASTLEDAREIADLARKANVPWFTSSSLRFSEITAKLKSVDATGVITWGPGPLEEHHYLDLSWYAIHPIEIMYAL